MNKVHKPIHNGAVQYSLDNGDKHIIGEIEYRGRNPVYQQLPAPYAGAPVQYRKVEKGIPFVKVGPVTK